MAEESSPQRPSHPPTQPRPRSGVRYRASKACRRCNEKRVKCDASERGTPCTRCIDRQEPDCRLIQSRRGIYLRKPRRLQSISTEESGGGTRDGDDNTAPPASNGLGNEVFSATRVAAARPTPSISPLPDTQGQRPSRRQGQGSQRARRDVDSSISSLTHDMPFGDSNTVNASSHSNISWAAMFDHLLEGHRNGSDALEKCSITYLGESFPLAIILKDLRGEHAGPPLLHHPGPPRPVNKQAFEPTGRSRSQSPALRPEELAFLEAKGALTAPASDTLDSLMSVFFDTVFPIYPIVNRQEFLRQYKLRKTPWILLHSLCSVAATFCPPQVLYRAGFDSRQQARWLFYSKAKVLFDVGYETDKIVLLQVAILMSFWGGGPDDIWNFYSWIGMGVTMAETIGCHRSMAGINIKAQDKSLLRRLWWVLVVRDASSAALIGRPFKVNLDHCDVEALSPADFEHDSAPSECSASQHARHSTLYQIQATKLTLILRRIIKACFQPQKESSLDSTSLRQLLGEWRSQLPPELNWSGNVGEHLNVSASTLCTVYNHHIILTYLGAVSAERTQDGRIDPSPEQGMAREAMNQAAQQIALVACYVVTRSELHLAPHELFHGVFVAAVVFYMQTKSNVQLLAQLAMSGLTNCKMVFQASRETWDPSPWFAQLFDKSLFALNPHLFQDSQAADADGSTDAATLHNLNVAGCADTTCMGGLFPLSYDMWQNHPVLGNLFDMAPSYSQFAAMGPDFDGRPGTPWLDL
ncbi:hypothetical protein CPLU01_14665 [Colletotrichum plurivorum]|uniref:Zn(2)-C6 fungal-type domain-containing protein n=1 Tax=Colletotrichum plurivorum TaxID=2175906 RepID=A0A8H6MYY7_9PEZI|nr:hypothetical protein CPLU01_14665 [Colletotrichum plurivorum]